MTGVRVFYDAVDLSGIPADARRLLAYIDGRDTHGNYAAARARFPRALIGKVTVTGATLAAAIADVEKGDLTPDSGVAWACHKINAGQHPTLYAAAGTMPAVKAALAAAGVGVGELPDECSLLVAAYDGRPVVPAPYIGHQYLGHPGNSPGPYDVSVVRLGYWPGVDPPRFRWLRRRIRRTHARLEASRAELARKEAAA